MKYTSTNNMDVRKLNKINIFKSIVDNRKISKQEISHTLHISMPTVLQNVKELIDEGLVEEVGSFESTGGRKAKALSVTAGAKLSLGMDITKSHLSIILLDLTGEKIQNYRVQLPYENTKKYYNSVGEHLHNFIRDNHISREKVLGVGISIPGIVDDEEKKFIKSYILKVEDVDLTQLQDTIHFPCKFLNDANAAGLAEKKNVNEQMIYLSLSYSVGGAIFFQKQLYEGDNYKSGEFGHMVLIPGGHQCDCGRLGCVDTYCSSKTLSDCTDGRLDVFFQKLSEGNSRLLETWDKYLNYVAMAVTNLRMAFDCDIVIGGYVGGYLDNYMEDLKRKIIENSSFDTDANYVKMCQYKNESAAIGAGMQFLESFYEELR